MRATTAVDEEGKPCGEPLASKRCGEVVEAVDMRGLWIRLAERFGGREEVRFMRCTPFVLVLWLMMLKSMIGLNSTCCLFFSMLRPSCGPPFIPCLWWGGLARDSRVILARVSNSYLLALSRRG